MTLPTAQPAIVARLWPFWFLWLPCNLDPNTLLIDLFSVHFVNCLLDRILSLEDLNVGKYTMKA